MTRLTHESTVNHIAATVMAFLTEHPEGFNIRMNENHTPPSKWDGGRRTLTIEVTCVTDEPRLTESES